MEKPARDFVVDAQVVISQIINTRNFKFYAFLIMKVSQILKREGGRGSGCRHRPADHSELRWPEWREQSWRGIALFEPGGELSIHIILSVQRV